MGGDPNDPYVRPGMRLQVGIYFHDFMCAKGSQSQCIVRQSVHGFSQEIRPRSLVIF